jgi:hypothetical protein
LHPKNAFIFGSVVITAFMWLMPVYGQCLLAPDCSWTTPISISESPKADSRPAVAVGDIYGFLHVFWSETPSAEENDNVPYVMYRRWDAVNGWTMPMDVLVGPAGGWVNVAAVVVAREQLHLLWYDNFGVNVSSAPLLLARNARTWHTTRLVFGERMPQPTMTVDEHEVLHILYVQDFQALMYTRSVDGNSTWSAPTDVWDSGTQARSLVYPDLAIVADGTLHAVWQINEQELDWLPSGIAYANSADNGLTWQNLVEFSHREGGNPAIVVDTEGHLNILWNGRAGSRGRYYVWSADGGRSWISPQNLEGYMGGLSGRPQFVRDSLGVLHVVQGSTTQTGRYTHYATLQQHRFSQPVDIPDMPPQDWPFLAITGGNRLHVFVWTQVAPAEILYTTCLLQAPQLPPAPLPTLPTDEPLLAPIPAYTATPRVIADPLAPGSLPNTYQAQMMPDNKAQLAAIFFSSIAAGSLVLATVLFAIKSRKRC